MTNLVWNVVAYNPNKNIFEAYNVFSHYKFTEAVAKMLELYADDKEKFAEDLDSELMYYFYSKSEWNIDVYCQVKMNLEAFVDYVWMKGRG